MIGRVVQLVSVLMDGFRYAVNNWEKPTDKICNWCISYSMAPTVITRISKSKF